MKKLWWMVVVGTMALASCSKTEFVNYTPANELIRYAGRVDFANPNEPILISSASYIEFNFKGDSCIVSLKKLNPPGEPNYISIELDGVDQGRIRLESETMEDIKIKTDGPGVHRVRVFKATEAQNNQIAIGGVKCIGLKPLDKLPELRIEFIGNSITCGMGNDMAAIPCDSGLWYNQHNAYWAYGPIVARELEAQFLLSSVSGIGMYRNWNSLSPVMPEVYENLYLNTDVTKRWDFNQFTPDLISICLGTNDLSLGDGANERLPFDSASYVDAYIKFLEMVYQHYPRVQVCLLTSPMVHGEPGVQLSNCLNAVKQHYVKKNIEKPLAIFEFPSELEPHGCSYHPDIEDHKEMAEVLMPFYKVLMNW